MLERDRVTHSGQQLATLLSPRFLAGTRTSGSPGSTVGSVQHWEQPSPACSLRLSSVTVAQPALPRSPASRMSATGDGLV
jgi:hypothetical protein